MQMAVIEYARNVLGLSSANSTEMDVDTPHPVISLMDEQKDIEKKGGTMRLGAWDCTLTKGSRAQAIYKQENISERHRHRYEVNNAYLADLTKNGLKATGINPKTALAEIVEIDTHPWFVGVQYHPEYKSTVLTPHPLFTDFVKACSQYANQ
jgi:CTP synthase